MTRVVITGANGFLGWHLRALLHGVPGVEGIPVPREAWDRPEALEALLSGADAVVHLAGMNRGKEEEVAAVNLWLAEQLANTLEKVGRRPRLVFANSIHCRRNTPYGRSKQQAARRLADWAARARAPFLNLILPHVFGEGGRPFYNSVVHTFCHQLARGEFPKVEHDSELQLLHAQTVAEIILQGIREGRSGDLEPEGTPLRVSQLLRILKQLAENYERLVLPDLRDPLCLSLFNTYRSFLFPERYPVPLQLHQDERGKLFEAVKSLNPGQIYISTTQPGHRRGRHYHRRKVERFLVMQGTAEIRVRRLFSDEVIRFNVQGREPAFIDIPTLHTHDITNTGEEPLWTLFWANELFDPASPDTYRMDV